MADNRKPVAIFGPSGAGDEDVSTSDIFVCIVTDQWMEDIGCWGQAEYAQSLNKFMVALIKTGTKNLEKIDRFPWKKKYYFANDDELKAASEEIFKLDERESARSG